MLLVFGVQRACGFRQAGCLGRASHTGGEFGTQENSLQRFHLQPLVSSLQVHVEGQGLWLPETEGRACEDRKCHPSLHGKDVLIQLEKQASRHVPSTFCVLETWRHSGNLISLNFSPQAGGSRGSRLCPREDMSCVAQAESTHISSSDTNGALQMLAGQTSSCCLPALTRAREGSRMPAER